MTCLLFLGLVQIPKTLPPVDQGPQDALFVAYRNNLLRALKNQDVMGIKARIADDVVYSVGDPDAKGEAKMFSSFRKQGGLAHLYAELEAVLKLGGHFTQSGFWAPYTYQGWPEDLDPFENAYGVVPRAKLYDLSGKRVVGTLENFGLIKVYSGPFAGELKAGWRLYIDPKSGQTVAAPNKEIRTNADYRALFEKRNGVYQLTFFASGD